MLQEIQNGTFHTKFPYSNINSKQEFLQMLDSCPEPTWIVEQKWDGWFTTLCELGLFSKTGRLLRSDIKSKQGQFYNCEYLQGTQWAIKHKHKDKLIVHWSNQQYGSQFDSNLGFWVPRFTHKQVRENFDQIISGFEGLILKNLITGEFFRYKQSYTGDYVITGIELSDAESFNGVAIKGFKIGLYINGTLVELGNVGGGLDYNLRVDAYNNQQKYIGKVIQCSGKGVFESGKLRHPSFEHFRTDKNPDMCTLQQFKCAPEQKTSFKTTTEHSYNSNKKKCHICHKYVTTINGRFKNHGPSYNQPCKGGGSFYKRNKEFVYEQYDRSKSVPQWKKFNVNN
jgi:hypothetical protein